MGLPTAAAAAVCGAAACSMDVGAAVAVGAASAVDEATKSRTARNKRDIPLRPHEVLTLNDLMILAEAQRLMCAQASIRRQARVLDAKRGKTSRQLIELRDACYRAHA